MKKTFYIIAAALVLTLFASGVLAGCNANNAASAANAGKNTAKKVDTTIARLECLQDKDFGFPSVLGSDFFINEKEPAEIIETSAECTPGVDCEPSASTRYIGTNRGYNAKHFGRSRLNHGGTARTNFLDKVDDLYVLCADISAANTKCNEISAAIKEESVQLRQLSNEMKKSGKKGKNTFAKFNADNRELNASVARLNRDRNSVKAKVKANRGKKGNSIDVEATTMENLMIMNRLENRLRLLEDTHSKLVKVNDGLRLSLGKTAPAPATIEPVKIPDENSAPARVANDNPVAIQNGIMPLPVVQQETTEKPSPAFIIDDSQPQQHLHQIQSQHGFRERPATIRRRTEASNQNPYRATFEHREHFGQQLPDEQTDTEQPVKYHNFRTLPYIIIG